MNNRSFHSASFRDPSGYVFIENGLIKRCINPIYFKQYFKFKEEGFYNNLFSAGLLIRHEEIKVNDTEIIIQPEQIPFITYPYEWGFNQYKEAALLTLKLQKYCLDHNFTLKDASAFNVVFHKGKAVFIDSLSFDFYQENKPWRAYKQFIIHFLGPLVLAKYIGPKALGLMVDFIDGIPLNMLSSMLPLKTKLNPFLYSNIHLLAKFESKHSEDYKGKIKEAKLSKKAQLNIVKGLFDYINNFQIETDSEWGNYYSKTNYSESSFILKSKLVDKWVNKLGAETLVDIGGNDGTFVRRINRKLKTALVCDIDNNAVDLNFKLVKANQEKYILPLVIDVLNPSPSIGFNNTERASFLERIKAFRPDVTMALAVIHHLTLSGNVPFLRSAEFLASFSKYLIIEFPKREDSWVQRLLKTKGEFEDYFDFYNVNFFEKSYTVYFSILEKELIVDSNRIMYLLKRKE
ncbi:class I SAM-dependent methyltransferase [Aestuariivivens sp. NBU2969]|uniref:class I SAM-dependent methyltransferase n=1 Tax=Aestuariivivens sp. NBU2969 TaxID=2873267 RepID=UPI001CBA6C01|nr:class I SAM-dependent methyltransferase [Aestuariivivens sp. NBU2969]